MAASYPWEQRQAHPVVAMPEQPWPLTVAAALLRGCPSAGFCYGTYFTPSLLWPQLWDREVHGSSPIGPLAGQLARCPLGPVGEKVRWNDCPVAHMCRHRGAGCVHVAVLGGGGLPLLASAVKCRCAMNTHVPAAAGLGCGCALPWVFFPPQSVKLSLQLAYSYSTY